VSSERRNLFGLSGEDLAQVLAEAGEPGYRARQLYAWLYARRERCFEAMTDLSRPLRGWLAGHCEVAWPALQERSDSSDGTRKYLLRLADGASVEAVYIPEPRRRTICVSTQAGCPLRCGFCLTGIAGYTRNLGVGEILGQVAQVLDDAPPPDDPDRPPAWNVVMMGMGEPLLNEAAVFPALDVLMDPGGFAIPPRKLTLSTVGIVPALLRLAQRPVRPGLAISLHAPNSALRRRLMPIEERYSLEEVIRAARGYASPGGGGVTWEYVLLAGVNDRPSHARELAALVRRAGGKLNLIPLNPTAEIPFQPPTTESLDAFCAALVAGGARVSVRRPRGRDVLAACGQLHRRSAGHPPQPPTPPAASPA
jgi:23S rRNA (adenine2503-C2)-methyltransferase